MHTLVSFFSTYLYLLSGLYFLAWWIALFASFGKAKDTRKRILVASALSAAMFPLIERLTLTDWWSPVFVWNAYFHIEDALFGLAITGTTLGIYCWASKNVRTQIDRQAVFPTWYRYGLLAATIFITFAPFYFLHISSFYSGSACMLLFALCVFAKIPRMILPAAATGVLLTLLILPGYFLGSYLHPGWIQEYWKLADWPGQLFLTIPLGEYAFYLLFGLFMPALAEVFFARSAKPQRHA